jgi:hypothetical protein
VRDAGPIGAAGHADPRAHVRGRVPVRVVAPGRPARGVVEVHQRGPVTRD